MHLVNCLFRLPQRRLLSLSLRSRRQFHSGSIQISEEVRHALHNRKPVVALESTIITHGMPYPDNIRTALRVKDVVRQQGAVPATIAILGGKIHVGLNANELEQLADMKIPAYKTSRADIPYVLSQGLNGGTTVSGTMVVSHKVGIPVFVTGGVGGVHRGAESSMDVSADLTELGRTPVAVVSSGVKSILDIGRTVEYLETQGVSVVTYGETKAFPAFFTPTSGFDSPYNIHCPEQAARMIHASQLLGLQSGMLIAVPIPECHAANGEEIEQAIQLAVREARDKNIIGKNVTPYILQRVNDLTAGKSLAANIELVLHNADVGSRIACELAKLQGSPAEGSKVNQEKTVISTPRQKAPGFSVSRVKSESVVVIGGTNVDFTAAFTASNNTKVSANGATYPGSVKQSLGGVGRNLADCLSRLGVDTLFISAVGNDAHAQNVFQQLPHMNLKGVKKVEGHSTATYCAILQPTGDLVYGIGDFDVHSHITPEHVMRFENDLLRAALVCIDANMPVDTIDTVCRICSQAGIPVWLEPTDLRLLGKVFECDAWKRLTFTSPNLPELRLIHNHVTGDPTQPDQVGSRAEESLEDTLEECVGLARPVLDHTPVLLVTLGQYGGLLCINPHAQAPLSFSDHLVENNIFAVHFPNFRHTPVKDIVSVSGAGDCFAAGVISGLVRGLSATDCMKLGLLAAPMSLLHDQAIPDTINPATVCLQSTSKFKDWKAYPIPVTFSQPIIQANA